MISAKKLIGICLAGTTGLMASIPHNASANTSIKKFQEIEVSLKECLSKANRPGFPYYSRPEAANACKQSKDLLYKFAEDANRNKNLTCFSRVPGIDHDIWMIEFLGSSRMQKKIEGDLKNLKKSCYNMDTKY